MFRVKKTSRARELRRDMTPYERTLWKMLRDNQMEGFHWRRQHPVGPYIADFACIAAKSIVELDGNSHDERQEDDANRDAVLAEMGWRTLRIPNRDLINDAECVWQTILVQLQLPESSEDGNTVVA